MKHVLLVGFMLLSARTALAQESGQVGLEFGTNAVGVIFHLTDKFAIRPEGTFSFGSSEAVDINAWGAGVSALFYLNRIEKLSTYFVPRFMYQRSTTSGVSSLDLRTNNYDVSGSFGAQYALHRRFSVFGEVGLSIRDSSTSGAAASLIGSTSTTTARTVSGFGGILYFN